MGKRRDSWGQSSSPLSLQARLAKHSLRGVSEQLARQVVTAYADYRPQAAIAKSVAISRRMVQRILEATQGPPELGGLWQERRLLYVGSESMETARRKLAKAFPQVRAELSPGESGVDGQVQQAVYAQLIGRAAQCLLREIMERVQRMPSTQKVRVALAFGRTIAAVVAELGAYAEAHPLRDQLQGRVRFLAMVGHTLSYPEWGANTLVSRAAQQLGGEYRVMPTPAFVKKLPVRQGLMEDVEPVREALRELRESQIVVTSLSPIRLRDASTGRIYPATLESEGFIAGRRVDLLIQAGAVGEICGWPFDAAGKRVLTASGEDRYPNPIGIGLEGLQEIARDRSAIAVVGADPLRVALRAALLGGFISVLCTDVETAQRLVLDSRRR